MNKIMSAIAGLFVPLAVACSGAVTTEPPGRATAIPTPTTAPQVQIPTPRPVQEWTLEGVSVDGDSVTVSLFFHSTASVDVTLDGRQPTWLEENLPILGYVFEGVAAGEHSIEIRDVMGNSETAQVSVAAPQAADEDVPEWLSEWLAELEAGGAEFPPQSITRYISGGEAVYYVVHQCCDRFSDLLDADGNLIGHPDGGFTGRGDGVTFFSTFGRTGDEVWSLP